MEQEQPQKIAVHQEAVHDIRLKIEDITKEAVHDIRLNIADISNAIQIVVKEVENSPTRNNKHFSTCASYLLAILTTSYSWLLTRTKVQKLTGSLGVKIAIVVFVLGLLTSMVLIVIGTFSRIDMMKSWLSYLCLWTLIVCTFASPAMVAVELILSYWLQIVLWILIGVGAFLVGGYLLHRIFPNAFTQFANFFHCSD